MSVEPCCGVVTDTVISQEAVGGVTPDAVEVSPGKGGDESLVVGPHTNDGGEDSEKPVAMPQGNSSESCVAASILVSFGNDVWTRYTIDRSAPTVVPRVIAQKVPELTKGPCGPESVLLSSGDHVCNRYTIVRPQDGGEDTTRAPMPPPTPVGSFITMHRPWTRPSAYHEQLVNRLSVIFGAAVAQVAPPSTNPLVISRSTAGHGKTFAEAVHLCSNVDHVLAPRKGLALLVKNASAGDIPSGLLAALVMLGRGLHVKNRGMVEAYCFNAIEAGLPSGHVVRALLVLLHGVAGNATAALRSDLDMADRSNDPYAYLLLGFLIEFGIGTPVNYVAARRYYQSASAAGVGEASYRLAKMENHNVDVRITTHDELHWYEKAVEQNSPRAAFELALCLASGVGVNVDETRAISLFEHAARLGHLLAASSLKAFQICRATSKKTRMNLISGMRRLADAGDTNAMLWLRDHYIRGEFVPYNLNIARQWNLRAIANGSQCAVGLFSQLSAMSDATHISYHWSYQEVEIHATRGNRCCELRLARMLRDGIGVPHNPKKTLQLLLKLAEENVIDAMCDLVLMYRLGPVGICDPLRAQSWIFKTINAVNSTLVRGKRKEL